MTGPIKDYIIKDLRLFAVLWACLQCGLKGVGAFIITDCVCFTCTPAPKLLISFKRFGFTVNLGGFDRGYNCACTLKDQLDMGV